MSTTERPTCPVCEGRMTDDGIHESEFSPCVLVADGWAKLGGAWVEVEPFGAAGRQDKDGFHQAYIEKRRP